jgi:hypothetical protein
MVEETLKRYADDITLQELVRLRVENERLRESLKNFCDAFEPHLHPERCQYCSNAYWEARAALKGDE